MGKRLFVGNLSYYTTEDTLREAFEAGDRQVTDVHIVLDRDTGLSRGFGFVELATNEEAMSAVEEMDGQDIDGRTIRVNEAQARRGGDRGGGGGGY